MISETKSNVNNNQVRVTFEKDWPQWNKHGHEAFKVRFTLNTKTKTYRLGKYAQNRIDAYDLIEFLNNNLRAEEIEK